MRERPILFSGPMVRALLDGRKTQTRRVVKPRPRSGLWYQPMWGTSPDGVAFGAPGVICQVGPDYPDGDSDLRRCPYGTPGDRLWVREAWLQWDHTDPGCAPDDPRTFRYRADGEIPAVRWRPSIFMPRRACRLVLELTDLRVEPLQTITGCDAIAEGMPDDTSVSPRELYADLWDDLNAARGYGWDANPWVWVLTFRPIPPSPSVEKCNPTADAVPGDGTASEELLT